MNHGEQQQVTDNPLFSNEQGVDTKSSHHTVIGHRSGKHISVPNDTTLADHDWELIEDDLLPFQIVVIIVSLGGVALFVLGIHMLAADNNLVTFAQQFFGVFPGLDGFVTFIMMIPIFVGALQVLLAFLFSGAAALEKWKQVSIQDVLLYHLPRSFTSLGLKHVRLHCTARGVYVWTMIVFFLVQLVAAGIALGVNDFIDAEVNKGNGGDASSGLLREVLDYTSAMFNECCATPGFSRQGAIPRCLAGQTKLEQCNITDTKFTSMQHLLCACYVDERYDEYVRYVNQSQLCEVSRNLQVKIEKGQTIPGTTFSFRTLVPSKFTSIPVVGDVEENYGCGVGFLRGFQWSIIEWSTAQLRPYFEAMVIISAVQLLLLAAGMSVVCRVKQVRELGEDGNYVYAKQGLAGLESMSLVSPRLNLATTSKLLGKSFRQPAAATAPVVVVEPQLVAADAAVKRRDPPPPPSVAMRDNIDDVI